MSAGTALPSRGAVPGPCRTPLWGVGRCSRLGPVLRDGSFSPRSLRARCPFRPFLFPRLPSGPVLPPLFPSGTGRSPQRFPSGTGPPCPSSRTPPLSFRAEFFLLAFPQNRGHPLPLQLPSGLGPFPPPFIPSGPVPSPPSRGQGVPYPPPSSPGDRRRSPGAPLGCPATPGPVLGAGGERRVKGCSLLTPVQCGSTRCCWDISTFQVSAVGAAAGKKP